MFRVPYYSVVGSLMYAMVCLRPSLAYVVSAIQQLLGKTW